MYAPRFLCSLLLAAIAGASLATPPGPTMTLELLQKRTPFESWRGYAPEPAIAASQQIYRATLASLVKIGAGKSKDAYMPTLNRYIEEFNRIDEEFRFIETVEREDICERLAEILAILALPGINDCDDVEAVRDW
jgi:hypothetical protein